MALKILILGVNGFIGSTLTDRILLTTDWEVYGMDMEKDKLNIALGDKRFNFVEGDITINKEWIAYHIKKCDVVLPLVAIATPSVYVNDPLRVFELDFEANLEIVRACVKYKKRIIFPSTSEVYGMSNDTIFDEETSNLVVGPINKQRWIYSCSKQLMDRIIFAYGVKQDFEYTLFRPFNWIGPRLDRIDSQKEGSSRALTLFISNILHHSEIKLVNGGKQRRSFTYIDDGVDGLMKIIENKDQCASRRIFNLGNPTNDLSVEELVTMLLDQFQKYPKYASLARNTKVTIVDGEAHYGEYYQDSQFRVPSIENARTYLGWKPSTDMKTALKKTLDYYLLDEKHLPEIE